MYSDEEACVGRGGANESEKKEAKAISVNRRLTDTRKLTIIWHSFVIFYYTIQRWIQHSKRKDLGCNSFEIPDAILKPLLDSTSDIHLYSSFVGYLMKISFCLSIPKLDIEENFNELFEWKRKVSISRAHVYTTLHQLF